MIAVWGSTVCVAAVVGDHRIDSSILSCRVTGYQVRKSVPIPVSDHHAYSSGAAAVVPQVGRYAWDYRLRQGEETQTAVCAGRRDGPCRTLLSDDRFSHDHGREQGQKYPDRAAISGVLNIRSFGPWLLLARRGLTAGATQLKIPLRSSRPRSRSLPIAVFTAATFCSMTASSSWGSPSGNSGSPK